MEIKMVRQGVRAVLVSSLIMAGSAHGGRQIRIPVVDQMTGVPSPLVLRDWRQTAREVDAFVIDLQREGKHLPVSWMDRSRVNYPMDVLAIPSYVGDTRQNEESNEYDTITCFGAVLGATLIGIDKSDQDGVNYVEMLNAYFNIANGIELYLNNVRTVTGNTFWYDQLPSLLFYQVYDHYRDTPEMSNRFVRTAERWNEAVEGVGGAEADFDWTGYDFQAGRPVDNQMWKEPDAAAGTAWILYMAYVETGRPEFLTGARHAMGFLERREENPYYEVLLPYGAYLAARMNVEQGTGYSVEKLVNWVFDGSNPRRWGVTPGGWGEQNLAGLTGSVHVNHEYAFAMNTFVTAGVLLPLVRYDSRFAEAFGKWMLNVAVHSRYFYADAWSPEDQTCWSWAERHDPTFCLAYEGIRKQGWTRTYATGERPALSGRIEGTWKDARYEDGRRQILRVGRNGKLEHVWEIERRDGLEQVLVVQGDLASGTGEFIFHISDSPGRGWEEAFRFSSRQPVQRRWKRLNPVRSGPLYLRVEGKGEPGAEIAVQNIYIQTKLDKAPYAMGDPTLMGWGKTDFGLYGSVFVGLLGAMVEPTDVEGILRIDCRATESFAAPSYPTHLYYNPYRREQTVTIPLPDTPVDLYDAVGKQFVRRDVAGSVRMAIPARRALLLVETPAGVDAVTEGNRTWVDGVVIDYDNRPDQR